MSGTKVNLVVGIKEPLCWFIRMGDDSIAHLVAHREPWHYIELRDYGFLVCERERQRS